MSTNIPMLKAAIDLIVKSAPDLRAAGVTSLTCDGISVTLAPAAPEPADEWVEAPPQPDHTDPLSDPATYPNGVVPSFDRADD